MAGPLLEAAAVGKSYGGTVALRDVHLALQRGQVHALVGENGAGKSTLVKIVSGGLRADSGALRLDGRPYAPLSPAAAQALGVAAVHQELSLIPYLPVYQNLWLGHEETRGGLVARRVLRERSLELCRRYGMQIDVEEWIDDLSLESQQVVEILKALSRDPDLVIFDEPTSALGSVNTKWLLGLIGRLRDEGKAVLFISHRLAEVMALSDAITVLKDGRRVGTVSRSEVRDRDVVRMMVGRELADIFPPKADASELAGAPAILEVSGLSAQGVREASLAVRAGEVVGLAGLEGQGQHQVLLSLFGLAPKWGGTVEVRGRRVSIRHPKQAIRAGMGLVPVDRRTEGVILPLSVAQNVALPTLGHRQRLGFVDRRAEARVAARAIEQLSIRTQGPRAPLLSLSGGNQQKVALAKWLAADPRILLLDDPTRGVDIEARADIYHRIRGLARDGRAILINSTDVTELVGMCDRVLVMYEGAIARELSADAITEENIVAAAVGAHRP